MGWLLPAGTLLLGALALGLRRQRRRKLARSTAERLLPEIRALLSTADPGSESAGEPAAAEIYASEASELANRLSPEVVYALETFYGCLEDYRSLRFEMIRAFAENSDVTLGDRIRAKDRRDRSLKDVYYTGEAAIQKLTRLTL